MNYSFNRNAAIIALQHLRMIAPGAVCGYCIYLNSEDNRLHIMQFYRGNEPDDSILTDENNVIGNQRKPKKVPIQWFTPDNDPIKNNVHITKQLEIFSESEHTVLCLRIESKADYNQDLVFIEFKQDLSVFGIQPTEGKLDVHTKKILGLLLYNSVLAVIKAAEEDALLHNDLSRNTVKLIETVKKNKAAVVLEQKMHKQSIERLANGYIESLSQKYNRKIILSEDAVEVLWMNREAIHKLGNILSDAVKFAVNLTSLDINFPVIINEELLFINEQAESKDNVVQKNSFAKSLTKDVKAEQFLYRLLKSVEKLMAKGQRISGKTVGVYCEPSLSAPAITEFIRKYRKQINILLKENPSKWAMLVNEFRPIQNTYYTNSGTISKTG